MISIGECRICSVGQLGLRLCGGCQAIVILCKECDSAWYESKLTDKPAYADDESMPCPVCRDNLWSSESQWANSEEVSDSRWLSKFNIKVDDTTS